MPPCGPQPPEMVDGTTLIKWLAPLPVAAVVEAADEEPAAPEPEPVAELERRQAARPPVAAVVPQVVEVEAAAVGAAERQLHRQPRKIFNALNRICFM